MINDRASRRVASRFILVGIVAFIVNYIILEVALRTVTASKPVAAIIAMLFTIHLTFFLHTKWTYTREDASYYMRPLKRYFGYMTTNSTGSVITIVGFSVLSLKLPNIVSLGIAASVAMAWNFLMNLIVWRHDKNFMADIISIFR